MLPCLNLQKQAQFLPSKRCEFTTDSVDRNCIRSWRQLQTTNGEDEGVLIKSPAAC